MTKFCWRGRSGDASMNWTSRAPNARKIRKQSMILVVKGNWKELNIMRCRTSCKCVHGCNELCSRVDLSDLWTIYPEARSMSPMLATLTGESGRGQLRCVLASNSLPAVPDCGIANMVRTGGTTCQILTDRKNLLCIRLTLVAWSYKL